MCVHYTHITSVNGIIVSVANFSLLISVLAHCSARKFCVDRVWLSMHETITYVKYATVAMVYCQQIIKWAMTVNSWANIYTNIIACREIFVFIA